MAEDNAAETNSPAAAAPAAELQRAIAAGLAFLAASQESDGGFALEALASERPGSPGDNLFSTATVLALTAPLLPETSMKRAVRYILDRRDRRGFWGWAPDGSLPPDVDDTACCLGALIRAGVTVDRREGARLLRKFWRWGGPFRTWLAPGAWNERNRDDPVVNCNVLWALGELGVPARAAERRSVEAMVAAHRGPTRYYCSEASLAWAAARVGIATPSIRAPSGAGLVGRPLECALWSLALPAALHDNPAPLIAMQEADGGWSAERWVRGYVGAWQSRPVTAAFAIAALSRLLRGG